MTAMLVSRDGAGAKHDDLSADEDTDEDHRARLRGPLAYDDPGLLAFIRQEYLSPPSRLPYNLQRERTDSKAVIYNSYITMDPAYLPMQRLLLKVRRSPLVQGTSTGSHPPPLTSIPLLPSIISYVPSPLLHYLPCYP